MKFRLRTIAPVAALFCELLGLASLALTPDIERPLFLAPILLGAIAWMGKLRIPDRFLLLIVATLVVGGYLTAGLAPTGTLMARAMIPVHAVLWLATEERLYRFWRLGLALLELVLAAILSPEAHMFVLIFFFVLFSSLALSLGFIERRFLERDPEAVNRPIRGAFLGSILALSCAIFLSSLVIFPLLPRSHWNGKGSETTTGYTDVVSYQNGILKWGEQDSRPVLWIFQDGTKPWEAIVPYFLLRGQALDKFDGHEWRALPGTYVPPKKAMHVDGSIEIDRKALPTDVLPVPYGALQVASATEFGLGRLPAGEWTGFGSRGRSIRYTVHTGDFRIGEFGDLPKPADSEIDAKIFPETLKLAGHLGRGLTSPEAKIGKVMKFFRDGGFKYELRSVGVYQPGKVHPVEAFLTHDRNGHCELFSAGAALLLRALGVPARLVVGFRLRSPTQNDVLTVHASDAHAWVEAWTPSRGWRALDPTPVEISESWFKDFYGTASDLVGAYWNRYIIEYEFDPAALINLARSVVGVLSAITVALGFFLLKRKRRPGINRRKTREKLSIVRAQFENELVSQGRMDLTQAYEKFAEAGLWKQRYFELRFGRREPSRDELAGIQHDASLIIKSLSSR